LVIGAIELFHLRSVDAFGLASSDADFTQLAKHLTDNGMHVYGFGEGKTPASLRDECTEFTVVPGRVKRSKVKEMGKALVSPSKLVTPAGDKQKLCADPAFLQALRTAVVATEAKSGWSLLTRVRTEIDKHPFELRGYGKFSKLMETTGLFEIRRVGLVAQVRVKPQT
jgi:NYN domain